MTKKIDQHDEHLCRLDRKSTLGGRMAQKGKTLKRRSSQDNENTRNTAKGETKNKKKKRIGFPRHSPPGSEDSYWRTGKGA